MDKLKIILKIVFSVAVMAFIVSKIDLAALGKVLSSANILLIILSFFVFAPLMLLMVVRWKLLLDIFHKEIPFKDLVSVYWIGLFFSLFLPSAIGGDAVKMYKLSKHHGKPIEVSTSVLMDRIVGLTSLCILSFGSILIFRNSFDFDLAGKIIGGVAFFLFMFYLIIFNVKAVKKIPLVRPLLKFLKIEKIVRNLYLSFNFYFNHFTVLLKAVVVSFACNLIMAFSIYLLALAVGINISVVYFFVIMPIVFMISILPISMSGLGLQDGAYVFFLGQVGVPPALAFSMSLIGHVVRYLTGLIGGIFYLFERDRSRG